MRTKTRTVLLSSALKLASHTAMGVAVGLAFSLILTRADPTGIMALINHSDAPEATLALFEGTIILTFAIGATLTGLVFMMTEDGNA
jgi:predicted MFS family arabinose efflux permease